MFGNPKSNGGSSGNGDSNSSSEATKTAAATAMAGGDIQQSTKNGATETVMATEMVTVAAMILTWMPMPTTAHQQQQQGQHAWDVPRYCVGGDNVGGEWGGAVSKGRGGSDGSSRSAIGHWAYQAKKEEEEQTKVVLFVNEN